jgi:hypothetical protein
VIQVSFNLTGLPASLGKQKRPLVSGLCNKLRFRSHIYMTT